MYNVPLAQDRPGDKSECFPGLGYWVDALVTSKYQALSDWLHGSLSRALRAVRDLQTGSPDFPFPAEPGKLGSKDSSQCPKVPASHSYVHTPESSCVCTCTRE